MKQLELIMRTYIYI